MEKVQKNSVNSLQHTSSSETFQVYGGTSLTNPGNGMAQDEEEKYAASRVHTSSVSQFEMVLEMACYTSDKWETTKNSLTINKTQF
jgi:hypothetical protein